MPRNGFIDAADDMLIDFEDTDAENAGVVTPSLKDSIRRMAEMDLPVGWIARQLLLKVEQVEEVVSEMKNG